MNATHSVLGVFAHPDDETFGPGGTLARLSDEGHTVHLLCATRGEAGTIGDSASYGPARLAELRTAELIDACRVLGLEPPRFLDLPDGGLSALDPDRLLRPIVEAVRRHGPSILIVFDKGGLSGHADHRTMTARALEAFDAAASSAYAPELGAPHAVARVWAYCFPESMASRVTFRQLVSTPDEKVDARIDILAVAPRKHAAVAAHASQKPFIDRLAEEVGDLDAYWSPEAFVLERSRAALPAGERPVDDLFAGM